MALFAFTSVPDELETRIELSTPITNLRRLREGVYLHQHGVDPYESSSFYHSPLYLSVFSTVVDPTSKLAMAVLWTLIDFIAASALRSIWRARKQQEDDVTSPRNEVVEGVTQKEESGSNSLGIAAKTRRWLRDGWDESVMTLYLLNPYTIATCLARSTTSIDNALTLLSISYAAQGQASLALFFLSLAVHSQFYPVLLLTPIMLVLLSFNRGPSTAAAWDRTSRQSVIGWVTMFVGFIAVVHGLAYTVAGSNRFIYQTWGTILSVSDLTPNVGLSWYFFTEMFDHFRRFFTGVFQLHMLLYVVPLCIRFRHQPLLATVILSGIISIFKSYPTLGDAAVWLGLLGCFPDIWDALRHPLLTGSVLLYSTMLLPILLELWLVSATGNANFLYAAAMVHSLGCGLGVLDMLGAALRSEVARHAIEAMNNESTDSPAEDSFAARQKAVAGHADAHEKLKSATRLLEDRDLVVVQYTTLDEA
ncbi:hypothetical protein NCC49_001253 [Naganishia albida]|nr:hypothetical protein NCC49_001253 [Naganishia albida]